MVDNSNGDYEQAPPDTSTLRLSSIPEVDTVILVPEEEDIEAQIGRVRIEASPWAVVYFNGDSVGTTPLPPITANPGTYRIELRNPDFPKFETLVDVLPGGKHL